MQPRPKNLSSELFSPLFEPNFACLTLPPPRTANLSWFCSFVSPLLPPTCVGDMQLAEVPNLPIGVCSGVVIHASRSTHASGVYVSCKRGTSEAIEDNRGERVSGASEASGTRCTVSGAARAHPGREQVGQVGQVAGGGPCVRACCSVFWEAAPAAALQGEGLILSRGGSPLP